MNVGVEALLTSALGLKSPWAVSKVELDTAKRRIDFEVACNARQLPCPACGVDGQGNHDKVRRDWRHLDFFQHEAWRRVRQDRDRGGAVGTARQRLHAAVRGARPGTVSIHAGRACRQLVTRQFEAVVAPDEHYVGVARVQEDMSGVAVVGIDDLSFRRGQTM